MQFFYPPPALLNPSSDYRPFKNGNCFYQHSQQKREKFKFVCVLDTNNLDAFWNPVNSSCGTPRSTYTDPPLQIHI